MSQACFIAKTVVLTPDMRTKRCRAGPGLLDDDNFASLVIFSPRHGSRHQTGQEAGVENDRTRSDIETRQEIQGHSSGQLNKQSDETLI